MLVVVDELPRLSSRLISPYTVIDRNRRMIAMSEQSSQAQKSLMSTRAAIVGFGVAETSFFATRLIRGSGTRGSFGDRKIHSGIVKLNLFWNDLVPDFQPDFSGKCD